MGKLFTELDEKLVAWIKRQSLFFVGTAPLAGDGHVNVSPKGPIGSFRVLGPHEVCYLDFVGSGAETVAHLRENGRIVVMFCAFDGPPRILRLHGRGSILQAGDPGFAALHEQLGFEELADKEPGWRSIVKVDVTRIADSCGFGVPLLGYEGERPQQLDWIERKLAQGEDAIKDYVAEKNTVSLDGLAALDADRFPGAR
jgi:hypothetical protein